MSDTIVPYGISADQPLLLSQQAGDAQARLANAGTTVLGKLTLHDGRDPFTPPHTRVDWVPSSIPYVKAPRVQKQWMNSKVTLVIEGPDTGDVKDQFGKCLATSALAGLLAGLVTAYVTAGVGGVSAGLVTFTNTLKQCLEAATKQDIGSLSAHVESSSAWDKDWS